MFAKNVKVFKLVLLNMKKLILAFLCSFVFLAIWFGTSNAATLYLLPQSIEISLDKSVLLELRLEAKEESVNSVEAHLFYPNDLLEIQDVSLGGSFLDLMVRNPEIDKTAGVISIYGGTTRGFSGDGLAAKIRVSGKKTGEGQIKFISGSRVLLHDGKGTPAPLSFLEGNFQIRPPAEKKVGISSGNCPDQDKWCGWNNLDLFWETEPGVSYSYVLSHESAAQPDAIAKEAIGQIRYQNLEDGAYYFRLAKIEGNEAKSLGKFQAFIDATDPEPFEIKIGEIEGKKYAVFTTFDRMSGISHYEIQEGAGNKQPAGGWKIGESPYLLENQTLQGIIKVRAYDKAGNERMAEWILPKKPFPREFIILIPAILLAGAMIWLIRRPRGPRL